jgi:hypothetical protein
VFFHQQDRPPNLAVRSEERRHHHPAADRLAAPVGRLNGVREQVDTSVQATNRRGKTISCRVMVSPLFGADREIRGTILLMEEHSAAATH